MGKPTYRVYTTQYSPHSRVEQELSCSCMRLITGLSQWPLDALQLAEMWCVPMQYTV